MFKHLALLCCIFAFAGLQVHNVVPHHHTETHESDHHKNHHHDKDDDDHQSPFSGQYHDVEFGKSIIKPVDLKTFVEKPAFLSSHFILIFDKLAAFSDIRPKHIRCYDSALYVIYFAHDTPLRAPPFIS